MSTDPAAPQSGISALICLALSGCLPGGALDLVDPLDLASPETEEAVEEAWARWLMEVGPSRVDVQRVVMAPMDEPGWDISRRQITMDPRVISGVWGLEMGLCAHLDRKEGHTLARPELFGEEARHDFPLACALGPPDVRWRAEITAACGVDELGERDAYLADEVYLFADEGRRDGTLRVREAGEVQWEQAQGRFGDELLGIRELHRGGRSWDHRTRLLLGQVDPESGEGELVGSVDVRGGGWLQLADGPDGVAVMVQGDGAWTAHGLDPDGVEHTMRFPEQTWFDAPSRVGPHVTAQQHWWETAPLLHLDLEAGTVGEIALPEAEEEGHQVLVSSQRPWRGRQLVELMEATVHVGGELVKSDPITIGIAGYTHAWLDPATGTWTELTRDLHMVDGGLTDDGLLWGYVFSDAGSVMAAYDVLSDELLVNDSVCMEEPGRDLYPWTTTPERAWFARGRLDGDGSWSTDVVAYSRVD